MNTRPRRHLRDASKICAAFTKLSNGLVINRCELDAGHDGKHKDGCSHWGNPTASQALRPAHEEQP